MKITRLTVHDCRLERGGTHAWNPVLVRIDTDEGITGWGEAATGYYAGAAAVVAMLREVAPRVLIGADASAIEKRWNEMHWLASQVYGGGAVGYAAMSAVDQALWDIKGKAAGMSVYQLLGGAVRDPLRVYANGWCYNLSEPEQYADAAAKVAADGFTAMKFDPFRYHEGGWAEHPEPGGNLPRKWLKLAEDRIRAVREAVGEEIDIILEAHAKFSPAVAIEIGRRMSQFGLFFYEEPVSHMNPAIMREVHERVPVPLSTGERLTGRWQFRELIESQAVSIVQPDLGITGGISEGRRIADFASLYDIKIQPHNCSSPLLTFASVQLDAALNNFIIQETFPYREPKFMQFVSNPLEPRIRDGYLALPEEPGLGVVPDEGVLAGFEAVAVDG
jgi:L-alanine-DL-glutamate epimerase-like enolase superfamily enzyme